MLYLTKSIYIYKLNDRFKLNSFIYCANSQREAHDACSEN